MQGFSSAAQSIVRSSGFLTGVLCLLAATGCAASDVGDSEDAAELVVTGTADQALVLGNTSLPWRGAPPKNVVSGGAFDGSDIITGVDVGMSNVCQGRPQACVKVITGLKVSWYNTLRGTTNTSTVGRSNSETWTRQLCPFNSYVDGYNIGVEPLFGKTQIRKFGIHCQSVNRVGTNLPILGSGNVLFPEFLSCSPFTTSPLRYIDIIRMNLNGDGIDANCTA